MPFQRYIIGCYKFHDHRWDGKRAEVINSDECCIIEELRVVLLTKREGERKRERKGDVAVSKIEK